MAVRRALVAITVGAIMTVAAGGCSLLVATDGLATSTDAAPVDMADAPRSETSAPDVSVAEAASDAGSDASEASTGPFCASLTPKPKFCADFDIGSVGDYGTPSGAPSLDLSISKSMPASLRSSVEVTATKRGSLVEKDLPDTPTAVILSFDLFVDEYDIAHDVELVTLNFVRTPTDLCNLNVAVRSDNWTIDEGCVTGGVMGPVDVAHRSAVQLQRAHWTHIDVAADFAATGRKLTFLVDGTTAFDGLLEQGFVTGQLGIAIGIPFLQTEATSRATVHTDNVILDYR